MLGAKYNNLNFVRMKKQNITGHLKIHRQIQLDVWISFSRNNTILHVGFMNESVIITGVQV